MNTGDAPLKSLFQHDTDRDVRPAGQALRLAEQKTQNYGLRKRLALPVSPSFLRSTASSTEHEPQARRKQRKAEHLSHSQPAAEKVADLSIGHAEEFHEHAAQRIQHGEKAGHGSARAGLRRVYPKDEEGEQTFKTGLVELGRVTRQRSGMRENHAC